MRNEDKEMITATETRLPRLLMELPGPQAKRVIEDDAKFMSPSLTREYPLVAKKGYGAIVEDIGKISFLVWGGGAGASQTGPPPPKGGKGIKKGPPKFIHFPGRFFNHPH